MGLTPINENKTDSKIPSLAISAKPTEETKEDKTLGSTETPEVEPTIKTEESIVSSAKTERVKYSCPQFDASAIKERITDCNEEQCTFYLYLAGDTSVGGNTIGAQQYPLKMGDITIFTKSSSVLSDESDVDEYYEKVPTSGGESALSVRHICKKGKKAGQNLNNYYCTGGMVLQYNQIDASGIILVNDKYLFSFSFDKDKNILETKCLTQDEYWEDYWA